jgi:hypothetical protein
MVPLLKRSLYFFLPPLRGRSFSETYVNLKGVNSKEVLFSVPDSTGNELSLPAFPPGQTHPEGGDLSPRRVYFLPGRPFGGVSPAGAVSGISPAGAVFGV